MSSTSTDDDSAIGRPENPHDLTHVEGIGPDEARWLTSVGISTIIALANVKATTLANHLSDIGHPTNLRVLRKWIAQGKQLVSEMTAQARADDLDEAAQQTEDENAVQEADDSAAASAPEVEPDANLSTPKRVVLGPSQEWTSIAYFNVEFQWQQLGATIQYQTVARHVGTDQAQIWSGLEEEKLQGWINAKLSAAVSALPSPAQTTPPAIDQWVTPIIENLCIYQPPAPVMALGADTSPRMFPAPLQSNLAFVLEVQFSLPDQEALAQVSEGVFYQAEYFIRNVKQGKALAMGEISATPLVPHPGTYTAQFPAMNLEAGIFRLQVLLKLQGIHATAGFIEVPILQVD